MVQPSSSILMTVPEFPIPELQSHRHLKPNLCLHLAGEETHNPKATSTCTAAAVLLLPVLLLPVSTVFPDVCFVVLHLGSTHLTALMTIHG